MTDSADQVERVLLATGDIARILREVIEHLATIEERLARIEGRLQTPNAN
jgi:hypothetical protein